MSTDTSRKELEKMEALVAWLPVPDAIELKACPRCSTNALEGEVRCTSCGIEPGNDWTWREFRSLARQRATAIAFNRLTSMLAQVYGEEGLPEAPYFVQRAHGYALDIALGLCQWVRPEDGGNTPEEAAIVAMGRANKGRRVCLRAALVAMLSSEDLTDEALRKASEHLLPAIADELRPDRGDE